MTERVFEADNLYAICKRSDRGASCVWCNYELLAREEHFAEDGSVRGADHAKVYLQEDHAVELADFILSNLAEVYYIDEAIAARDAVKKLLGMYAKK
jgi:hypothetical protein